MQFPATPNLAELRVKIALDLASKSSAPDDEPKHGSVEDALIKTGPNPMDALIRDLQETNEVLAWLVAPTTDEGDADAVSAPGAVEAEAPEDGEPMPDALRDSLARLVEPDANEAAKKAALMSRWINLKAQMEELKLPERNRVLAPITPAEIAEFEQLEAYMSWFK